MLGLRLSLQYISNTHICVYLVQDLITGMDLKKIHFLGRDIVVVIELCGLVIFQNLIV